MQVKLTLTRNGSIVKVLTIDELKKFTNRRISIAVKKSFSYHFKIMCRERIDALLRSVHERSLDPKWTEEHPEEITLRLAYEMAMKASRFFDNDGRFHIMDLSLLDILLPMGGPNGMSKKGWWRIHEPEAEGGLVGGSGHFGFVRTDFLLQFFKESDNYGRFGEGFMVDINKPFWKKFNIKPFPGVAPKRYLRKFQMKLMKDIKLNQSFHDKVMKTAIQYVIRGE